MLPEDPPEPIDLAVPWYSQYDTRNDDMYDPPEHSPDPANADESAEGLAAYNAEVKGEDACFRAARQMALDYNGVGPSTGYADNYQILSEGEDGEVQFDAEAASQGIAYIDAQLEAGNAVVVGTDWTEGSRNDDGVTDHFVTITGRGQDEEGTYYTFNEPGTRRTNYSEGRLYVGEDGNLQGDAWGGSEQYEMTMVVENQEPAAGGN
jgi:hypothetical protein